MSVLGNANSGRYSNPDLDAKLAVAKRTLDDAKRELSELSEIVFNDVALIPMRYEVLGPRLGCPEGPSVHDASRPVYAGHECQDLSEEF